MIFRFSGRVTVVLLLCLVGCTSRPPAADLISSDTSASQPVATEGDPPIASSESAQPVGPAEKVRSFSFFYAGVIDQLEPGAAARVWLPQASSNFAQEVELGEVLLPVVYNVTKETKYGNPLIYFEATANENGQIPFSVEYHVRRRELRREKRERVAEDQRDKYLSAAALAPTDANLLDELLGDMLPVGGSLTVARTLYDAVDDRMSYQKPENQPWGRGDAVWACGSGLGNCTDFHSLFLSICRESGIPSQFEIGFPIPNDSDNGEVAGYHCWAKFIADERWIPVDISEADKHPELKDYYFGNLSPDRVTFSIGRDLQLDPPQAGGPVNFLVYPYVEVAGKPHTSLIKNFHYQDAP